MTTLPFPLRSICALRHVGTLNPADKSRGSHEGAGLSVSLHPDAWRVIARGQVRGDDWTLFKSDGLFLDYHELSEVHIEQIAHWGVTNGYVERGTLYQATWFDDELDSELMSLHLTREQAGDECSDPDSIQELPDRLVPTAKLKARVNGDAPLVLVPDLLATVFAEEVLSVDGVWWEDRLDVYAYSAPRGVISATKLPSWQISLARDEVG